MNNNQLKVAIVEPSVIIRSGISVVLKRIPGYRIQSIEILSTESIARYINIHKPDILIINPTFWGYFDVSKIKDKAETSKIKCIALVYSTVDMNLLRSYDETLSIYDSVDQLKEKLDKLFIVNFSENSEEQNTLSSREKEIIIGVVKGMTNKEIALSLFLSAHTVISHRKNIARKLEIHTTAGLTIYAIVNKLIEIEEVKK
ncbi:MAG: response regulator transcription factor [Paludibacter sp.]|nr:response regulator transcription factor [Paludibacter sp.]